MKILKYQNQGHMIVLGWSNAAALKNWTAYTGADGQPFAPPFDRNGYTAGVLRRLNTAGIRYSGYPISKLTFPVITDGQIETIRTTLTDDGVVGNVTMAVHVPGSMGRTDVSNFNAVLNLEVNQLTGLKRSEDGYRDFVLECVIVEVL